MSRDPSEIESGQLRRWSRFEDAEMDEIFLVLGRVRPWVSTWCILQGEEVRVFDGAVIKLWSETMEQGENHPVQP